MKPLRVQARRFVEPGRVYVVPDVSHPEVDLFTAVDDADALIVVCSIEDEQRLRDIIAVEQERPRWWREVRRIEDALRKGGPR
jgi:hypothetical protein